MQLTRAEDGTPVDTRAIGGTLKLRGRADLATGSFETLENADIGDPQFECGNTVNIEYELPAVNPPAFFQAVIVFE